MKKEKFQTFLEKTLQVLGVVFSIIWTILKWWFLIGMFCFGLLIWLLDLWLGDGRNPVNPPWKKPHQKTQFDPNQVRQELPKIKAEDFLKEFGKQLEKIDNSNQLQQEEKKVVRKLRDLDRSALKSQLSESLNDDEIEILFIIILKLLGIEFK